MTAETSHDPYASLRYGAFRLFVIMNSTFTVAMMIQSVVVQWQVYALTRDPLWLGMIGLAEALPFILVAIFSGHLADRYDRKKIGVASLMVLVLCSLALLLFSYDPQRFLSHGVLPIFVVIAASGVARSFQRPATGALSAQLVPRELYANAVTWRSSMWQGAAVVGPALGGFLYAWGGATKSYLIVAILVLGALLALLAIPRAKIAEAEPPKEEDDDRSVLSGVRFVLSQKNLLGAMTLDLFSVLFGGAVALLPIYASEILHVGPTGLGLLRAAPAIGSVAMGLWLAHRPGMKKAGPSLLISVGIFGLTMILFGVSTNFYLSMALLIASGAADAVSVVIRSTLLQVATPGHMLGRVSAVNQIFIGSSNEIGAFESGVAAKLMGTVPSVVFGGIMTIVVVAVTAGAIPSLRRLERIDAADSSS